MIVASNQSALKYNTAPSERDRSEAYQLERFTAKNQEGTVDRQGADGHKSPGVNAAHFEGALLRRAPL